MYPSTKEIMSEYEDHSLPVVIMWAGLILATVLVASGVLPPWAGAVISAVVSTAAIILNGLLSQD
jgi:hypothetical protein